MEPNDLIDNRRILELRLAYLKVSLAENYGEEMAMKMLQNMSDMFNANYAFLVQIFNKPYQVINHPGVSKDRKFQEVMVMGEAFGHSRAESGEKFLNVSKSYIYQKGELFNTKEFLDEDWASELDDSVLYLGIPASYTAALSFLMSFKIFMEVV